MKTLLFHKNGKSYEFKGFGNLEDAIDRCGDNITYDEESEKYYNEFGTCVAYAGDTELELDGDCDKWYVVNADDLDYKQAQLVAAEGIEVEGADDSWSLADTEEDYYEIKRREFLNSLKFNL